MTSYEEKMRALQWVKPDKKDEIFHKILRGDRSVDITQDEDIFLRVNIDRVPIERLVNRDKYKDIAKFAKDSKENLTQNTSKRKYMGEIPMDLWLTHPWFSPLLPKKEKDANIRKFFALFPRFKGE